MSGCICRHAHACELGISYSVRSIAERNNFLLLLESDKGFLKLQKGTSCLKWSCCCCHISQLPLPSLLVLFTMKANCFTFISMFDLCASELYIAQRPVIHGRLLHSPAALPVPNVLCGLLPLTSLSLLFQDQITPVILSLDGFVSGTCS